jgi:hypothetical protein
MKLQIERCHVENLTNTFPNLAFLKEQLRFGNKVEVFYHQLDVNEWQFLHDCYQQAGSVMQSQAALLLTIKNALIHEGERYEAQQLEMLLPNIVHYLIENAQRGWLFHADGKGKINAYLITRIDFTPPSEEEAGRIMIELKANSRGKIAVENLIIRGKDIAGKTIPEMFIEKNYLKETPELIATYDEAAGRYFDWRGRYGEQFSGWGTAIYAEDPTASHRNTEWSRKNTVVLSSAGEACRLVNDENILSDRALTLELTGDVLGKYLRKAAKSMRYNEKTEEAMESTKEEIPKGLFIELPIHGYILMFHLELHHHVWVHVDDIKPYEYQPELKQKFHYRTLLTPCF